MTDFFLKIEESGLAQWVRESDSLFAYAGILLAHTIGMGVVVGINATIDLRILGLAPKLRLRSLEKFFPVFWIGFWINAITGAILLAIHATKLMVNPDFYIKLAFIALALINLRLLRKHVFADPLIDQAPLSMKAKVLGITSMLFWLGAIACGRLLAYLG